MRVLWINPRFLDYRVPVYEALNDELNGQLTVVYSKARTPPRVAEKIEHALGPGAIGLTGERMLQLGRTNQQWANACLRIPFQPGLIRGINKIAADVIVAEGFFQWTPAALIKSMRQNVPLAIAYERTRHTERNCPWWRTAYRKWILRHVDALLCSGTQCADYGHSLGMPASRIVCGHMCADADGMRRQVDAIGPGQRTDLRERLGAAEVVFLYAGRLIELKGVRQLLESWSIFERVHPGDGTLIILGEGPLRPELERLVRERNLRGVRFLGQIDYDDIASYYAAADLFVLPTLEDNWALVVPEAMACGLPVICSRYNGACADLIRDDENGWIVDPLDELELANRLHKGFEQRARLPEMGRRSQEIIKDHTPHTAALSVIAGCEIALAHHNARSGKNRIAPSRSVTPIP